MKPVEQVHARYRLKILIWGTKTFLKNEDNPLIIQLCDKIHDLCTRKIIILWILSHVYIPKKKKVDKAAKKTLHSIRTNMKILYTDLEPTINKFLISKC